MKTAKELLTLYKGIKIEELGENIPADELLKQAAENERKKVYKAIYKSNFYIALYNEILPVVLEVLKKYEGKAHGEKTKEKIRNELLEKTNCYINLYSHDITINHNGLSDYCNRVTAFAAYKKDGTQPFVIDGENKIHALSVDDFRLAYIRNNYIDEETIPEYIEKIKAEKLRLQKMQEEFKKACRSFNDSLANGIPEIYPDKHIYSDIMAQSY